jgi:murein DD-endopeptidase MepM/ murein hydrolase activator NlpD
MKLELRIFIALLLSLLLSGGIWQVANAPDGNSISTPSPAPVRVKVTDAIVYSGGYPLDKNNRVIVPVETTEGFASNPTSTPASVAADSCSVGEVGSGTFVWPADNHFLSGNDFRPDHPGIDIAAGEGSPVYAADSGVVMARGNDEAGYGNVIMINHGNSYWTVYAHLSEIGVSMCQSVKAGQWIGAAGKTGNARGAHLHFEVVYDGRSVNPWLFLP